MFSLLHGAKEDLQEVLDDLVRDDVAHIVSIGQLGEGHPGYLCLLQISKRWPTTVT